jgi:hypothetical protein
MAAQRFAVFFSQRAAVKGLQTRRSQVVDVPACATKPLGSIPLVDPSIVAEKFSEPVRYHAGGGQADVAAAHSNLAFNVRRNFWETVHPMAPESMPVLHQRQRSARGCAWHRHHLSRNMHSVHHTRLKLTIVDGCFRMTGPW